MYFLYSLGGVTFNKCWINLSILNCYSPNFQGFILMKNALNNQVGMHGDMFLWLVANLKQMVIYFIKQACGNEIMPSVYGNHIDRYKRCFPNLISFLLQEKNLRKIFSWFMRQKIDWPYIGVTMCNFQVRDMILRYLIWFTNPVCDKKCFYWKYQPDLE